MRRIAGGKVRRVAGGKVRRVVGGKVRKVAAEHDDENLDSLGSKEAVL